MKRLLYPLIGLLLGTCGTLTVTACTENGSTRPNALAGQITVSLLANTTYPVVADVYGNAHGEFSINIRRNVALVNDCMRNAVALTSAASGLTANGTNATPTTIRWATACAVPMVTP